MTEAQGSSHRWSDGILTTVKSRQDLRQQLNQRSRRGSWPPWVPAGKLRCTNLQRGRCQGVCQRSCHRRLEVVADGLPLFHGAQLAVDTTMVSTVRADGAPRRQCAEREPPWTEPCRTKERTYPELTGEQGRARLVVLACETGGRWSEDAQSFLRHLARARARSEPREMQLAARRAWLRRWCTALACLRRSGRLRRPCWSAEEAWELTGRFRRPLTSFGVTATEARRR